MVCLPTIALIPHLLASSFFSHYSSGLLHILSLRPFTSSVSKEKLFGTCPLWFSMPFYVPWNDSWHLIYCSAHSTQVELFHLYFLKLIGFRSTGHQTYFVNFIGFVGTGHQTFCKLQGLYSYRSSDIVCELWGLISKDIRHFVNFKAYIITGNQTYFVNLISINIKHFLNLRSFY